MAGKHAHDHYPAKVDIVGPALSAARMSIPHLLPEVQKLVFSEDFVHGDKILVELTEDLVSQLENGARFVVRGSPEDSAVFCTQDRTFDVKARETSNTMLISPDLHTAKDLGKDGAAATSVVQITSMHTEFLELRTLVPRWNVAKHLLEQNPFSGLDNEKVSDAAPKYTFSQLVECVQSSETELLHYLQDILQACEIDGYWRLLDPAYVWSLCGRVMRWIDDDKLDSKKIPREEAETALFRSEPSSVMNGFFWRRFASQSGDVFTILEMEVRRQFCRALLRKHGKMLISAMEQLLRITVGLTPGLTPQDIQGFAFICLDDKLNLSNSIEYFPKEDLPTEPEARFQTLFDTRARWTKEEISPYVRDIILPGQTVEQLLFQYAKTFVDKRNNKRKASKTDE